MTLQQFRRMKVFALRMVPTAIGGKRWQNELRDHVSEVLSSLDDRSFACHWDHIINWDHITRLPDDDGTCGFALRDGRMLLCDFVREYCWDNRLEREVGDNIVESKMSVALLCCIRAACDVAVAPSAGVVGWTVGDLKSMWHNRPLPKWVAGSFEGDLTSAPDDTPVWL